MRSRVTFQRSLNGVPWFSISSAFQPAPTPRKKRPPEMLSSEAAVFASVSGWCSVTRQIAGPTSSVVVAVRAAVAATDMSCECQYSLGKSPPSR